MVEDQTFGCIIESAIKNVTRSRDSYKSAFILGLIFGLLLASQNLSWLASFREEMKIAGLGFISTACLAVIYAIHQSWSAFDQLKLIQTHRFLGKTGQMMKKIDGQDWDEVYLAINWCQWLLAKKGFHEIRLNRLFAIWPWSFPFH